MKLRILEKQFMNGTKRFIPQLRIFPFYWVTFTNDPLAQDGFVNFDQTVEFIKRHTCKKRIKHYNIA